MLPEWIVRPIRDVGLRWWNSATSTALRRRALIGLVNFGLMLLSSYLAIWLRFDGAIPAENWNAWIAMLPWLLAIRGVVFVPFRLYEGLWRYTSLWDARNIVGGVAASSIVFYIVAHWGFGATLYPRSVFVIDALLLVVFSCAIRLTRRILRDITALRRDKTVLIFGAGDAGEMIVRDMRNNSFYDVEPIGFIDDDPGKVGQSIRGIPVLGTRANLPAVMKAHKPTEVLIAIPTASPAVVREIVRALEPFKVAIKTLPNLRDILDGRVEVGQIRNLSVADLLTRAPVGLDASAVHQLVAGRRVLVTGAGGSIGSELCWQLRALDPAVLILVERYENGLYDVVNRLGDGRSPINIHPVLADITDESRIRQVFEECRPEIVFHAAAHKHVPLMEHNPCEAIKNNVGGTRLLMELAEQTCVDRFILISSDKAVNPTSVMGATKRVSELMAQVRNGTTAFITVRFGNVLGSNGSVVPRFVEQIRSGGPVTVTHPEVQRYFMLIPEAVQLVLHAAARGQPSATYVLDMGEQIKILDLAKNLIRLSGFVPEEDIPIRFTGLRPGEKLDEELVGRDELVMPSAVEKVLKVEPQVRLDRQRLMDDIRALEEIARTGDETSTLEAIRELLPGFGIDQHTHGRLVPVARPAQAVEVLPSGLSCPKCGSLEVYRSRTRSGFERMRKSVSPARLHRCHECGWRGWRIPADTAHGLETVSAPAPDLDSVDEAVAGTDALRARAVDPSAIGDA